MKLKFALILIINLFGLYAAQAQFVADFSTNKSSGCAPFVVNFKDLSTAGTNQWQWTTTAGLVSNQQNPTLIFTNPGVYSVTLTAGNGSESASVTKSAIIRVLPALTTDFTVNSAIGCAPLSVQFNDLSIPQSSTIKSWLWSFGNGETSTEQNPSTTFNEAKNYDVFLKITDGNGCESSVYKSDFIIAGGPKADFIFDSISCAVPAKINFISTSSGNQLKYEWDFGNGTKSNNEFPGLINFTSFDTLSIKLKITETGSKCSDSLSKNLYLRNYPSDFNFSVSCSDIDHSITVNNTTTPTPASVKWNFGDGTESFNPSETHIYTSAEARTITLTNTLTPSCISSKSITYRPPAPNFEAITPSSCSPPFKVSFNNNSIGNKLTYNWDFGDTSFSTASNPVHDFKIPPTQYLVSLKATDSLNCTKTIQNYVTAPFPYADFTATGKQMGCTPLLVDFANISSNVQDPIESLIWDFGDPASGNNNTASDSLVSHVYNEPGSYDVSLIIVLKNGCTDTVVYKDYIKVGTVPESADFTVLNNDTICFGETLNFAALSTYKNPSFASDYFCWSFEGKIDPLLSGNETPPIQCPTKVSSFQSHNLYVNDPDPFHLFNTYKYTDQDTLNPYIYLGKTDPSADTLYTHLIVGFNGCYQEVIKPIQVYPTVAMPGFAFKDKDFSLIACNNERTIGIYNASENYDSLIYFHVIHKSDGDTVLKINETDTVFYNFNKTGDYSIEISVMNKSTKCTHTTNRIFRVINPITNIKYTPSVCLNDSPFVAVDISKYSSGIYASRFWEINNVKKSAAAFPTVTNDSLKTALPDTGWHEVKLLNSIRIVDDLFGITTQRKQCNYQALDSVYAQGNKLKIGFDKNEACTGDSVSISNLSTSTSSINNYAWYSYPNGVLLGNNKSIKVAYNSPGIYQFVLKLSNSFGCEDSLISDTLLISKPSVNFTADDTVICKNEFVSFKNASSGNSLSYEWLIDNSIYSSINIIHRFKNAGSFDIKLKASDEFNCKDSLTISKFIRVADFPDTKFDVDTISSNCPPFSVQFSDSTKTSVSKWNWDFGDGNFSNSKNFLHTYTAPGKFDVSLIVTSPEGCKDTLTKPQYVIVKGPSANITPYDTIVCAPEDVKFKLILKDVQYYVWDFDDDTLKTFIVSNNLDSTNHNYTLPGNLAPKLTMIDSNGCAIKLLDLPKIKSDSILAKFDDSDGAICNLKNYPFVNLSNTFFNSTYFWDFGDNSSSLDTNPIHSFALPGNYPIKLVVKNQYGCKDSSVITLPAFEGPDEILNIYNSNFCVPSITDYVLDINNPNFIAESAFFTLNNNQLNGDSVRVNYTNPGSNTMRYTINYAGGKCKIDSVFTQNFYLYPIAEFNYLPQNNSIDNSLIFFTNTSQNASSYQWNFGDGNTQNIKDPAHTFNTANKYTVQLIASNEGNCHDTISTKISIAPYDLVKLPNAFTPDGDGINDEFGILFAGDVTLYLFTIYNRWGNIIFETNKLNDKWDGTYKGVPQSHGTYVYYVQTKNKLGETLEFKGNFSLIR